MENKNSPAENELEGKTVSEIFEEARRRTEESDGGSAIINRFISKPVVKAQPDSASDTAADAENVVFATEPTVAVKPDLSEKTPVPKNNPFELHMEPTRRRKPSAPDLGKTEEVLNAAAQDPEQFTKIESRWSSGANRRKNPIALTPQEIIGGQRPDLDVQLGFSGDKELSVRARSKRTAKPAVSASRPASRAEASSQETTASNESAEPIDSAILKADISFAPVPEPEVKPMAAEAAKPVETMSLFERLTKMREENEAERLDTMQKVAPTAFEDISSGCGEQPETKQGTVEPEPTVFEGETRLFGRDLFNSLVHNIEGIQNNDSGKPEEASADNVAVSDAVSGSERTSVRRATPPRLVPRVRIHQPPSVEPVPAPASASVTRRFITPTGDEDTETLILGASPDAEGKLPVSDGASVLPMPDGAERETLHEDASSEPLYDDDMLDGPYITDFSAAAPVASPIMELSADEPEVMPDDSLQPENVKFNSTFNSKAKTDFAPSFDVYDVEYGDFAAPEPPTEPLAGNRADPEPLPETDMDEYNTAKTKIVELDIPESTIDFEQINFASENFALQDDLQTEEYSEPAAPQEPLSGYQEEYYTPGENDPDYEYQEDDDYYAGGEQDYGQDADWERDFVGNRKKIARDFVLVGEDEDLPEEDIYGGPDGYDDDDDDLPNVEEYTCIDDAEAVRDNLSTTRSSLIMRFCFTGVMLAFLCFSSLSVLEPLKITGNVAAVLNFAVMAVTIIINRNTVRSLFGILSSGINSDVPPSVALCVGTVISGVSIFVPALQNVSLLYPAVMMPMLFNTVGKLSMVRRIINNFLIVANNYPKKVLFLKEELLSDKDEAYRISAVAVDDALVCAQRKTINSMNFLNHSYSGDPAARVFKLYTPISIALALLAGIALMLMGKGIPLAMNTVMAVLAMASPLSAWIIPNTQLKLMSQTLKDHRVAVTGFDAAERVAAANVVAIETSDLFPEGSIKLNKFNSFTGLPIHEAIPYSAAMCQEIHSIMGNMFKSVIQGSHDLPPADNIVYENGMGISGWVDGKRCLLGNRDLMIAHTVMLPDIELDRKIMRAGYFPLYFACEGRLSTLFVIEYSADEDVRAALMATQESGMIISVKSNDQNITAKMLADYFDLYEESLIIMPAGAVPVYDEITADVHDADGMVVHTGDGESFLWAVTACCKAMINIRLAIILCVIFSVLGVAAVFNFAFMGGLLLSLPLVGGYMLGSFVLSMLPVLRPTAKR